MGVTSRRRAFAAVALAVALVGASAACGDKKDSKNGSNEKITLIVDVFGQFGYNDGLYQQFEASHPNIKIQERGTGANLSDVSPKEIQYLATGAGAGDVMAIEEGTLTQMKAQADKFENLLDYGAADKQGNFLPWKWQQGMTGDGKKLIGLGTDVGGLAMCYRTDLFKQAGLPTNRDEVSKLWPTWDEYLATGQKFKSKVTSASFIDAATNVYNAILMQNAGTNPGYTYFDTNNNFVMEQNPVIKQSWDQVMKMIQAKESGNYQSFTDQWVAAFKQSKFATIACPAWMTGVIEGNAGAGLSGKWDIAKIPGGGGNWGGSFLSVPSQGKHKKEAAELAMFLTSPEGQIAAWKSKGTLPSSPQAQADPSVAAAQNKYFNNAPTGSIFAAGAASLKPVYLGSKNQAVRDQVENAIRSVEQGKRTPDQAWQDALKNAKKAAS